MKQKEEAYHKQMDDMILQQVENMELLDINVRQYPDEPCAEEMAERIIEKRKREQKPQKEVTERPVSTLKSREAARALSQPLHTASVAPKPKPSGASRVKLPSILPRSKKQPAPTNPSSMRHTAATANANTTLGYSKGRNISTTLREKSTNPGARTTTNRSRSPPNILSPETYMELYGPPPFGSEMWSRCKAAGYFDTELNDYEEEFEDQKLPSTYEEDEETANFELTL